MWYKVLDIILALGVLSKGLWILLWQLVGLGWWLVLFWILFKML